MVMIVVMGLMRCRHYGAYGSHSLAAGGALGVAVEWQLEWPLGLWVGCAVYNGDPLGSKVCQQHVEGGQGDLSSGRPDDVVPEL